jgi:hypothetical protein
MRVQVTVQAFDDELEGGGAVLWGYHVEEQVATEVAEVDFWPVVRGEREPTQEELDLIESVNSQNAGKILDKLLGHVEAATASINDQAAAGLPRRGPEGRP